MTVYHDKEHRRTLLFLSMVFIVIILSSGCSQDRFHNGIYTNKKYGFVLSIPENWRPVSEEEVIKCPTLQSIRGLDNRLIVTPSNPDDTAVIVSVLPITEEQFNAIPWSRYTSTLRSMGNMVIEDDTEEHIGGFDVHWVSGNSPQHHNGVVLFISRGKVMQIFYWVKETVAEEILTDIDSIVLSLQKTS